MTTTQSTTISSELPLLQTKLHIPAPRPELVSRPRLIERLNAGLWQGRASARRLTLVSAPAGFGKTTLVSAWVRELVQVAPAPTVCWLSLDESDSDLAQFLTYVIAALQTADAGLGRGVQSALRSPQPPAATTSLSMLINELSEGSPRIVLVLDDYHLLEVQAIHDALTFLLQHLPPQLHVVIATREDPPLPVSRLRARGQMTELRAADLRFTPAEAAAFLNHTMGLELDEADVLALERRTEGWIAGLQLAAVSMQGSSDTSGFIASFSGSHRYVLDYLAEEVLSAQPESIRSFLLQTSILERLSGPLCDAVTGQADGHATLATLDRANLFIVPLDEDRHWYRYHHLFAELLRQRLRRMIAQPDATRLHGSWAETAAALHTRASAWYADNGYRAESVEHMLRSGDTHLLAQAVEQHADWAWQHGEHGRLKRWLAALPRDALVVRPGVCITQAWYLFASGQRDLGEELLRAAQHELSLDTDAAPRSSAQGGPGLGDAERARLLGQLAAVESIIATYRGDVEGMVSHAAQALEQLPADTPTWRSIAALALGDAHGFRGDMRAALRARQEAVAACLASGDVYLSLAARVKLAMTYREQGHLRRAIVTCREGLETAEAYALPSTSAAGCLRAVWGEALAEVGDLEGALHQAREGVRIAESGHGMAMLGWSYVCLIRTLYSSGDVSGTDACIRKVLSTDLASAVPAWVKGQVAGWRVRRQLVQGAPMDAAQWESNRSLDAGRLLLPEPRIGFFALLDYVVLARLLISTSQVDRAESILHAMLAVAESGDRTTRVIEILLLQALARQTVGKTEDAMAALKRGLALAETRGLLHTFVDEGQEMARLLYEALARGIAPHYVQRLLSAFPDAEQGGADQAAAQTANVALIEPLSDRELEVLVLVAEGLTNAEVGRKLFVTLNTVKVHTRNIYGKLGVHNRTQAVTRAQALGILPST